MLKKLLNSIITFLKMILEFILGIFSKNIKNSSDNIEIKVIDKKIDKKIIEKCFPFMGDASGNSKKIKNSFDKINKLMIEQKYDYALKEIEIINEMLPVSNLHSNTQAKEVKKIVEEVKNRIVEKKDEKNNYKEMQDNSNKNLKKDNIEKVNIELKEDSSIEDSFKDYITVSTKIIKDSKKEFKDLKDNKNKYSELDYKSQICKIKKRLKEIDDNYYQARKNSKYSLIMNYSFDDPFDLKHDTIMLNGLINKLEEELKETKEVKTVNKSIIHNDKVKEEKSKSTLKDDKKVEDKVIVNEFDTSRNIILNNINRNLALVNDDKMIMNKIENKKHKKSIINRIFSNTIKFGISLFPFFYFKNRILGLSTSFILINNNIRISRRVLTNNDIKLYNECIMDINFLIDDTLKELNRLKEEIIIYDCQDIQIDKNLVEIKKYINKYTKVKEKRRAKVKKLEYK